MRRDRRISQSTKNICFYFVNPTENRVWKNRRSAEEGSEGTVEHLCSVVDEGLTQELVQQAERKEADGTGGKRAELLTSAAETTTDNPDASHDDGIATCF